ncbi:MAG TPA: tetratricopeptide repeat protein, partial [Alphaproteobacteria bacterium]|nr:tetratricopeptide repeat protein [Alphaproteobacteria bacterium]
LDDVSRAPMNVVYRRDIGLLVNECLIRAIEARLTIPDSNDSARLAYVQRSVSEGFIFTHYFYEALAAFEKSSTSMRNAYGDLLYNIDLDHERKRAHSTQFAAEATPEVINPSRKTPSLQENLLDDAEAKLAAGDPAGARRLAEQVVRHNNGGDEPGRASFILARAATLAGDMKEAQWDFEQVVRSVHDPRMLAWSHIYLGRIYDLQQKREEALAQYQAAISAGDPQPDTRAAAEKGLAGPYQPPKAH